jgi:hypothetical protein
MYPAPPSPPAEAIYHAQPAWQIPDAPSVAEQTWGQKAPEPAGGPANEVSLEVVEDASTDSAEPLADAFKLWGSQAAKERPQFPRFGPPLNEQSPGAPDAQQLDRDDFLR